MDSGCGNIFVRGAFLGNISSVSGVVSVVQFTLVTSVDGTSIQITFVTFQENGLASTVGFCGDQRSRFPMQQDVRTQFTPGQPCSDIVAIIIL